MLSGKLPVDLQRKYSRAFIERKKKHVIEPAINAIVFKYFDFWQDDQFEY